MSTSRWDPWRDIVTLREAMNNLLEESFVRPRASLVAFSGSVPLDVQETETEYTVYVPLAGVQPEDVEISVLGDNLRISGEFKDRAEEGARWILRERRFGHFERSMTFPAAVKSDEATADFEGGVLIVHLPKAEASRPKTITVKASAAV